MKKIRVLYIILNGASYGGSEKHVVDLVNNLPDNYEPVVIMSDCDEMYKQIDKKKCKEVFIVNRNSPFVIKIIRNIITKTKPDIVHAHAARGLFLARIAVKPFLKRKMVKLVCTAHGWVLDYLKFYKIKESLFLYNRNLDSATIAVSRESMNEMARHGYDAKKMYYVYNGIDIENYNKKARIKKEVNNVCFIGRFTDQKGIVYLMDAVLELQKSKQLHFNVYGSGERGDYMRQFIKEHSLSNVKMHGFVPPEQVINLLYDNDLLVLPSTNEGFPYILVEAIASGVPCVATNEGGVNEIIDDATGRLIEPKNVEAIVNAIENISQSGVVTALSKNCLDKSKQFGIKEMVAKTIDIYEKVMK